MRVSEIGVCREVAEIGLLRPHLVPKAVQEDGRLAEGIGELGLQHGLQIARKLQHVRIDRVVGNEVCFRIAGDRFEAGGRRGVGTLRTGRPGAGDDAVAVERHDETPEVAVLPVGADDHDILVPTGNGERIGVFGRVACPEHVVAVGEEPVGSAGDDDVDIVEAAHDGFVDVEFLQMHHDDDLVDSVPGKRVDLGLHDLRQRVEIRSAAGIEVGRCNDDVARRRDRGKLRCRDAHDADLFSANSVDRARRQAIRSRSLPSGTGETGQVAVRAEVEVDAEVREPRPGVVAICFQQAREPVGALVELVVAHGRAVEANEVHERDVGPAGTGVADDGLHGGIASRVEEGRREHVVAGGQQQRVGVLIAEHVDEPRKAWRVANIIRFPEANGRDRAF